jgi:hypothetical protein
MRHQVMLFVLLTGCGVPEDEFPERAGEAVCDRVEECTTTFESDAERADCEAFWSGAAELWVDLGELIGGEYDPGLGADCLREVRRATCAEFNEASYECDVLVDG